MLFEEGEHVDNLWRQTRDREIDVLPRELQTYEEFVFKDTNRETLHDGVVFHNYSKS